MEEYLFEYNEQDGTFHRNVGTSIPETQGYQSVCMAYDHIFQPFSHFVHSIYDFNAKEYPTFKKVCELWEAYLKLREDIITYDNNYKAKLTEKLELIKSLTKKQ